MFQQLFKTNDKIKIIPDPEVSLINTPRQGIEPWSPA